MNEILLYLSKASCCLLVLYLIYRWLFHRETFFMINRFYLLIIPLVSLVIPLISLPGFGHSTTGVFRQALDPVVIIPGISARMIETDQSVQTILLIILLTGTLLFIFRLGVQLIQISRLSRQGSTRYHGSLKLTKVEGLRSSFSFFNRIFVPASLTDKGVYRIMFLHEKVHVAQVHSFDIVLMELTAALFWFNPVIWLIRRDLKTIHEYLADQGVIRQGVGSLRYRQLIFDESTGFSGYAIVNSFNVSSLKKRLIMMTKKVSSPWVLGKMALVIPVMAGLVLLFASVKESKAGIQDKSQTKTQKVVKNTTPPPPDAPPPPPPPPSKAKDAPDVMPQYPGGNKAMAAFLVANIKYPEQAIHDSIQGKVFVQFKVEKDGTIADAKVLKGIGAGCDEEGIRVLKMMPKWVPAMKKGKPVVSDVTLPIQFKLQ